ncbi:MAG: hypothetical protein KF813_03120 [Trueperaceae bacterium]|nr:hypothetical protein [Trueperaceae bacterium]
MFRKLDPKLKALLRVRVAENGQSMEDEGVDIRHAALSTDVERGGSLLAFIRARAGGVGGVELEVPPREVVRDPPDFGG